MSETYSNQDGKLSITFQYNILYNTAEITEVSFIQLYTNIKQLLPGWISGYNSVIYLNIPISSLLFWWCSKQNDFLLIIFTFIAHIFIHAVSLHKKISFNKMAGSALPEIVVFFFHGILTISD